MATLPNTPADAKRQQGSSCHQVLRGLKLTREDLPHRSLPRGTCWMRDETAAAGGPVLLDIDASLVEIHSENKD